MRHLADPNREARREVQRAEQLRPRFTVDHDGHCWLVGSRSSTYTGRVWRLELTEELVDDIADALHRVAEGAGEIVREDDHRC